MDTNFVEAAAGRQRCTHSAEFKVKAIEACKPGISMAAVALANGLNTNMLRKWVNEARLRQHHCHRLLAQVLVAKYADHLPLYRQEGIFGRAGLAIARSTLGAWVGMCGVQLQPLADALKGEILNHRVVHADETPVQMLKPGNKKTHRAYLWA